MATKTREEKIFEMIEKAELDSIVSARADVHKYRVTSAIARGRVQLEAKKELARETASAEHAVLLEKASLILDMSDSEREALTQAQAVINGVKVAPKSDTDNVSKEESPEDITVQ
jgi:hypothetical protein